MAERAERRGSGSHCPPRGSSSHCLPRPRSAGRGSGSAREQVTRRAFADTAGGDERGECRGQGRIPDLTGLAECRGRHRCPGGCKLLFDALLGRARRCQGGSHHSGRRVVKRSRGRHKRDGVTVGREVQGDGRRGGCRAVLDGERELVAVATQVQVRVAPGVKLAGAAERLAGGGYLLRVLRPLPLCRQHP